MIFCAQTNASESLSYSGRLVNTNGSPVTGPVNLKVELAYSGPPITVKCSQDLTGVSLTNGVFHLKVDFDCTPNSLTDVLAAIPSGQAASIRVTDVSHSKVYSYQALHAVPFSNISDYAKQLSLQGTGANQVLVWNNTDKKWEAGAVTGASGGTVTNVTVSAPLSVATSTSTPSISLPQATGAQSGYLSSTDWTIFNNKEGTIAGGTAVQYYRGDKSWQTLDTSVVPENVANLYFTNARVLGVPLAGFVVGANSSIAATDSVLSAFEKTQGQLNTLTSDSTHFLKKDNTDSITGTVNIGVTGALTITNAPALPTDAANRQYVNTYADTKLALTGGTLSGVLTLDNDLKIKGGSNYVTVRGHATSAAYNIILPSSAGTSGQFLQTDGSGNLSWVAQSSTATPNGAAGGDLSGTYPNPTVPGLANKISTTLTSGNVLVGNVSNVATGVAISGDATLSNAGVLTLANTAVTAGTYKSVTVDGKGRVTGGTNPTTLAGYGITDTLVTGVSVTAPITNTGTATVPLIGMPAATGAVDGYLTSASFNTFNNKQAAITSASTISTGSLTSNLQGGLVLNPYNTAAGNTGEIRFNELAASGSNYVAFKAPDALGANVIYTLPTTDGTSGQVLTTNAAGVLSWSSHPTTAAPSGSAGGDLTGSYPNPTVANGLVATKISTGVVDNTEFNYLDGVTSAIQTQLNGKQTSDATLTSLAAYNTNGIIVQTAADTFVGRSIVGTANRLTVTNGDGVGGNPTLNIPTALLPSPVAGDAGKFLKASGVDTSAWTMLSSSDITSALGFTPINKAGDTMATGTFTYNGAALLRTLDPVGPTDVATKQYVDSYGQWTKSGSDIYRSSGNVGVGTTSPTSKFTVYGTATDTPTEAAASINVRTTGQGYGIILGGTATSGGGWISGTVNGVAGSGNLGINPSGGNVGIGTTSPAAKLQVENSTNTGTASDNVDVVAKSIYRNATFSTDSAVGNAGSLVFREAGTEKGRIIYYLIDNALAFQTNLTEKMRIDSNGNVGIGTGASVGGKLDIKTIIDDAQIYNINASLNQTVTASAGRTSVGVHTWSKPVVLSGVTNSGTAYGIADRVVRNTTGSTDSGTLASISGLDVIVGHSNLGTGTPVTTTVNGIMVAPQIGAGTITNYNALYLSGPILTGGTVTNNFGVYQADAAAKNHFAGNVGIGTDTPTAKLDVQGGQIKNDGFPVKTEIGYADQTATATVSGATWVDLPGATVTFTLTRAMTLKMEGSGSVAADPGATYTSAHCGFRFVINGAPEGHATWGDVIVGANGTNDGLNHAWWTPWTMKRKKSLAAGAYTIKLQMSGWSGADSTCRSDFNDYSRAHLEIEGW